MSDTIKIDLIKLDNTKLTIEQKGLTNNLKEILDKLPKEGQKEPAPKTEKPGKNLTITRLELPVRKHPGLTQASQPLHRQQLL
jgi:hypothetical protein